MVSRTMLMARVVVAAVLLAVSGGTASAQRLEFVATTPSWLSRSRGSVVVPGHMIVLDPAGGNATVPTDSRTPRVGLGTGPLSDKVAALARQFQVDHRAHAQAIGRLDGRGASTNS